MRLTIFFHNLHLPSNGSLATKKAEVKHTNIFQLNSVSEHPPDKNRKNGPQSNYLKILQGLRVAQAVENERWP